jgi:hypothetical protein
MNTDQVGTQGITWTHNRRCIHVHKDKNEKGSAKMRAIVVSRILGDALLSLDWLSFW